MKGLLIKDFMLLKNQKQFFGVIGGISILLLFTSKNPNFAIGYMTILFTLFTVNTITYDQYDKGMEYLLTLPVSRKGYIKSKYVLGIVMLVMATVMGTILAGILFVIRQGSIEIGEIAGTLGGSVLGAVLMLAVMMPIQLKFGAERSQAAILGVIASVFVIAFVSAKIGKAMEIDMMAILNTILTKSTKTVVLVCGAVGIAAFMISYLVSKRIVERKEF